MTASYVFYGCWDYRFLALIIASTVVDYFVRRGLARFDQKRKRRWLLAASIAFNLGTLGFFKYYNFFVESWIEAFHGFGIEMHASTLQIIFPVGISFYNFQTLSYSIGAFLRKIETELIKPTLMIFTLEFEGQQERIGGNCAEAQSIR